MKKRTVCLTCNKVFEGEDDPGVARVHPQTNERGPREPTPVGTKEWREWDAVGYRLECLEGHALPVESENRGLIVVSLFGETAAGKDAIHNQSGYLLLKQALRFRGLFASLAADHDAEHIPVPPAELAANSTLEATGDNPRKPTFMEISSIQPEKKLNLVIFNTAGEDNQDDWGKLLRACPFIPESDVLVFVVPPPVLDALPERIRSPQHAKFNTQLLEKSLAHLNRLVEAARRSMSAEQKSNVIVILALSKCDRYVGLEGFPQNALRERHHGYFDPEPLDITMFNEQLDLYSFIEAYGGAPLLEAAGSLNGRFYITATSGSGSDIANMAPSGSSAPNRSLDIMLIPLMRAGIGRLTQATMQAVSR